ncbi:MAG: hypothetical protein IT435_12200 [Phycisphaerales bacterium]|nr:hypothetical protein [Phycisphaerales bacterium]
MEKYSLDPAKLKESIRRHQHTNCTHGPMDNTEAYATLAKWTPEPR